MGKCCLQLANQQRVITAQSTVGAKERVVDARATAVADAETLKALKAETKEMSNLLEATRSEFERRLEEVQRTYENRLQEKERALQALHESASIEGKDDEESKRSIDAIDSEKSGSRQRGSRERLDEQNRNRRQPTQTKAQPRPVKISRDRLREIQPPGRQYNALNYSFE